MTSNGSDGVLSGAAARLAHEIRNSLAGIAGALDVLSERLPPEAETDAVMDRVRREVERIEQCVVELSVFATPPIPVLKRRNLHDVIDRALHGTAVMASTRVARDYLPDLTPMPLDEKVLGEALRRLFRNANDAMPTGGVLTVATRSTEEGVLVSVRDTGPGIRPQDLESLFEPFYSSKTRGLGLGLAIARRLIEAHGGRLTVTPLGESGAEFTILLPRAT